MSEAAVLALDLVLIAGTGLLLVLAMDVLHRRQLRRRLRVLDGAAAGGDIDLTGASGGDRC